MEAAGCPMGPVAGDGGKRWLRVAGQEGRPSSRLRICHQPRRSQGIAGRAPGGTRAALPSHGAKAPPGMGAKSEKSSSASRLSPQRMRPDHPGPSHPGGLVPNNCRHRFAALMTGLIIATIYHTFSIGFLISPWSVVSMDLRGGGGPAPTAFEPDEAKGN